MNAVLNLIAGLILLELWRRDSEMVWHAAVAVFVGALFRSYVQRR